MRRLIFRLKHDSQGQTLVEMVVATGMVALVLVAIVSGIALSVRNSRYSQNKALATRYGQQALERMRYYRDEFGWQPFIEETLGVNTTIAYCFPTMPDGLADLADFAGECENERVQDSQGDSEFVRGVTITSSGAGAVEVGVLVSWFEGSKTHSVTLTTRLHEWELQ